jgi:hypothetical protein
MVGMIPCRLSSEVHVSGQQVDQGQVYKTGDQRVAACVMEEPGAKCVWLVSTQGHENVGHDNLEWMQNDDGRRVEGTKEEKNGSTRRAVGTTHLESGNK